MNIIKSMQKKGNGSMRAEEIKKFLNNSRIKLKKVADSTTIKSDIQLELSAICTEIYNVNECIPGAENAQINEDVICMIVKTSERIKKLENSRDLSSDKEVKSVIQTIVSESLIIKQQFQTQAISAMG